MQQYILAPVQPCWERPRADWDGATPIVPVRLSPQQYRIHQFIRAYQAERCVSPLYQEIAAHCAIGASTVGYHIRNLVGLGLMRKPARSPRAIRLTHIPVKVD